MKRKEICLSIKKWAEILKDDDGFGFECGGNYIQLANDFYKYKESGFDNNNIDSDNKAFYKDLSSINTRECYKFNDGTEINLNIFNPFLDERKSSNSKNISQKWHFFISLLAYTETANKKDKILYKYWEDKPNRNRKPFYNEVCNFKEIKAVKIVQDKEKPNLYKPIIIYSNTYNKNGEIDNWRSSHLGEYLYNTYNKYKKNNQRLKIFIGFK